MNNQEFRAVVFKKLLPSIYGIINIENWWLLAKAEEKSQKTYTVRILLLCILYLIR